MSQQINLFNPVFLHQRKLFSLVAILQALGLIVLGSGLFYSYAVYQLGSLTDQLHETNKRLDAEQARLSRYTSKPAAQNPVEEELRVTEARLAAQHELIETLKSGAIGNTSGYSEYMRAFARQTVNGLWLTRFNITGDATQMSISGNVLSPELLAAYVRKLNQEQVMREKPFASLQMQRGGNEGRYVEFTLQSDEAERAGDDKAKDAKAAKK